MYIASITKGGQEVATITSKTLFGADNRALDYIDDRYDGGEEDAHEAYDFTVTEVTETGLVPVSLHCSTCGFPLCTACEKCHSLHCKKGVLMGIACSEVLDVQSETLYTVVTDRLALPVHFLTPNALSPEWYSPCQFKSVKEAADAFERYHDKPARYVDQYTFQVVCQLRMDEWHEWESVPSYLEQCSTAFARFCEAELERERQAARVLAKAQ